MPQTASPVWLRAQAGNLDLVSMVLLLRLLVTGRACTHPGIRFLLFHALSTGVGQEPQA